MSAHRDYEGEEYYKDHSGAEDGFRFGDFDHDRLDYDEDDSFNDAASVGSVAEDVQEVGAGRDYSSAPPTHPEAEFEAPSDARSEELDITPFLCPDHGMNLDRCDRAKRTLNPQVFESLRVIDSSKSSIPDASERFSAMRPAQKPSLVLPPTSMSYAQMVFKSVPLSKAQFDELIRNHVRLSPDQYKELMANIMNEKIIDSKTSSGGLKDIKNIMMANLKKRRQAEIPLLLLIDKTDTAIRSLKDVGISAGLEYPADAPDVVLLGPDPVKDHLAYSGHNGLFQLPDLANVLEGVELPSQEVREKILGNLDLLLRQVVSNQEKAQSCFRGAYDIASQALLAVDNLLNIHFLLSGHIDASVTDLVRHRFARMFTPSLRKHLTGGYLDREGAEEFRKNAMGIFGGTKQIVENIKDGRAQPRPVASSATSQHAGVDAPPPMKRARVDYSRGQPERSRDKKDQSERPVPQRSHSGTQRGSGGKGDSGGQGGRQPRDQGPQRGPGSGKAKNKGGSEYFSPFPTNACF